MNRPAINRRSELGASLAVAVLILSTLFPMPAGGAMAPDEFERCLLEEINAARAANGSPEVSHATELTEGARAWSEWMSDNEFRHMTSAEREPLLPEEVAEWGEDLAWWSELAVEDCAVVHDLLMDSDGHRARILDPSYSSVALGAYGDSSGWWVTELFFSCEGVFCDDGDSGFEADIDKIAAAGITKGCNPPDNTRYCPDQNVTRGEMAAFLARGLQLPSAGSAGFVDTDGVFEAYIDKIAAAGITKGCNPPDNTRYCPDQNVTRGEVAAFLARALDL